MEKKFEKKDKWDLLLDDQLNREAKLLVEVLSKHRDGSDEYQETDEERAASWEKLINRLKADGIYREEDSADDIAENTNKKENSNKENNNEDNNNEDNNSEDIHSGEFAGNTSEEPQKKAAPIKAEKSIKAAGRKAMSRRLAKAAGIVIVSGMCVFAASMTSEANRNYWLHNMRILTGKDTRDVTDNDDTNEKVNTDEYEAMAIIEKELQIDVPEFYYRPDGFKFLSYETTAILGIARIEYLYNDGIVDLYIDKNRDNSKTDVNGILGGDEETIPSIYEDLEILIGEIVDEKDGLSVCYAEWEWNDVTFTLAGRIELEELKKLVKELAY